MSNEFISQKKRGKKSQQVQLEVEKLPEPIIIVERQRSMAQLLEPVIVEPRKPFEPITMQTMPKKISPLIRNAIKAQPVELNFNKQENTINEVDEYESDDEVETQDETPKINFESECPGCYYCNWTGRDADNYGCKNMYYGNQS